jgi:hypothetical protein
MKPPREMILPTVSWIWMAVKGKFTHWWGPMGLSCLFDLVASVTSEPGVLLGYVHQDLAAG